MKKNILYLLLGILALTSSCQDPEYVLPTADRQGITSLTALFTSGPYVDKEAVVYTIADASVDKYVIPMPWYYPENSDNETSEYMKAMRIQAKLAPNCTIEPVLSILDLTKENYFMAGRHVVVFSLEMQGERLGDRWLLAATEGVDPQHLRSGQLTPGEVRQVHEASAELSRLPILIDDHPMTSMDRVRSSARLLKSKNRCDMVIVDYLQLCDMRSDQKNRNREQEVAQASRKAKLLAKELDIPVLLLSQLNRASDGTIDHRPTLSNLRESGAIEQDADMVMLLCRPALYGKTVDKKSTYPTDGLGIVIIAKHRNGKTGEVYFHHNQSMTKLVDYIPPLEWLTRNAK